MLPDDKRHGTNAGYNAGCREACCKTAHADYRRHLKTRWYLAPVERLKVDATGTTRRIHALMALGWRLTDIDAELGQCAHYTYNLTDQVQVHFDTARRVAEVYDRLAMTPGPSERTRAIARRKGWAPPLAWDDIDRDPEPATSRDIWDESSIDDAVIDRVLAGGKRPRKLTRAEAGEIVARSLGRGMSGNQIEDLYGLKPERYVRGGERVA